MGKNCINLVILIYFYHILKYTGLPILLQTNPREYPRSLPMSGRHHLPKVIGKEKQQHKPICSFFFFSVLCFCSIAMPQAQNSTPYLVLQTLIRHTTSKQNTRSFLCFFVCLFCCPLISVFYLSPHNDLMGGNQPKYYMSTKTILLQDENIESL